MYGSSIICPHCGKKSFLEESLEDHLKSKEFWIVVDKETGIVNYVHQAIGSARIHAHVRARDK